MADSRLDRYPRVGSGSKRAWTLLSRCKPFVLLAEGQTYFVQGGVFATPVDGDGKAVGKAVRASALLDAAKRPVGR